MNHTQFSRHRQWRSHLPSSTTPRNTKPLSTHYTGAMSTDPEQNISSAFESSASAVTSSNSSKGKEPNSSYQGNRMKALKRKLKHFDIDIGSDRRKNLRHGTAMTDIEKNRAVYIMESGMFQA
jgi:hypothetical protein